MLKNKKTAIIIAILIVLIAVVGLFMLKGNSNNSTEVNKKFVLTEEEKKMESYETTTPYVELSYPDKWKDSVIIRTSEEEPYTVTYFVKLKDKEEQKMFDIVFNGEGTVVKEYTADNGEKVTISVVSYELKFDDSWSQKEKDQAYLMQEDVNYLIAKLAEIE